MPGSPQTSPTFSDLLANSLNKWTTRVAFDDGTREYTYAEVADGVSRLISLLESNGGVRGRGVGVLSTNSVAAWMVVAATKIGGGYVVALPATGGLEDLAFFVNDARLTTLVVHRDLAHVGAQLQDRCPDLKAVWSIGPSDLGPDVLSLAADQPSRRLAAAAAAADDVVQIFYTGGTTGRAKGAVHTQKTWLTQVLSLPMAFQLPYGARYLAAGPISHSGYPWIAPVLFGGGSVLLNSKFDPEVFLRTIEEKKATFTMVVPTMVYTLLDQLRSTPTDTSSLQRVMYGASPMSPSRMDEAHQRFGKIFAQVYGVVEALGNGLCLPAGLHDSSRPERVLSCGLPTPTVSATVLDPDGQPVGDGEPGELCLRSPSVMREYWHQPEETVHVLRDGWLHTGDIATRDDEGFYTIVDRMKDIIVSGGFNVFSTQVEHIIASDPAVASVAVIAVPDPKWGEAVRAIVVAASGQTVDVERLRDRVRHHKGGVCVPKAIDVVDSLPVTAAGKVNKLALREPFWRSESRAVH
jgi:fatty-acyl-CoA synthase